MRSKTGRVVVRLGRLMDEYARKDDGSESVILADLRFDNHNKMTITGIVQVGTDVADVNPLEDADREMPRSRHYPVGYVGGGVVEVDIRAGDRVWFHYLCAEDRTAMERNKDGTWDVFMQVSDIFCLERDGRLITSQNWVVGDEVKDSGLVMVDAIGDEKAPAITPAKGIELIKGFNLDTYVDEAKVVEIQPCRYRDVSGEVTAGDRVYLAKDATFPNVIRNKKRILFRQTDIIAIWNRENGKVIPVGGNHLAKVEVKEYKSATISHTVITRAPEYGTIISSGSHCKKASAGDKVLFTRRWTRLLDKEFWLIDDAEILATVN